MSEVQFFFILGSLLSCFVGVCLGVGFCVFFAWLDARARESDLQRWFELRRSGGASRGIRL